MGELVSVLSLLPLFVSSVETAVAVTALSVGVGSLEAVVLGSTTEAAFTVSVDGTGLDGDFDFLLSSFTRRGRLRTEGSL